MENKSIGCSVTECKHHACKENYCTLNKIEVKKHGNSTCTVECTDCASFETK